MLTFLPLPSSRQHPLRVAWRDIDPDVIRVGAAFSTETGVDEFRRNIVGASPFDVADKRWLIGIEEGLTQPEALRRLRSLPVSDLRIPFGAQVLASPSLRTSTFYHPKIYYLENTSIGAVRLLSASANLTHRGLTTSVEQFLAWSGGKTDAEAVAFNEWWDDLWVRADEPTDAFIDAYEAKRPAFPTPPHVAHVLHGAAPDAEFQVANVYWIELTRRPEGGSFNQVELLYNGHFFFYPRTHSPPQNRGRHLTFENRSGDRFDDAGRQIMFNGPPNRPGGNHMWRVYMPTAAMGFIGYQDGDVIVRFERTRARDHYIVDVAPSRSPKALDWINASRGISEHAGPPPRRMGWA